MIHTNILSISLSVRFLTVLFSPQLFAHLYGLGVQQLLVEGGAETHRRFFENDDWWDEIRVETSPKTVGGGTRAPRLPDNAVAVSRREYDGNEIIIYEKVKR